MTITHEYINWILFLCTLFDVTVDSRTVQSYSYLQCNTKQIQLVGYICESFRMWNGYRVSQLIYSSKLRVFCLASYCYISYWLTDDFHSELASRADLFQANSSVHSIVGKLYWEHVDIDFTPLSYIPYYGELYSSTVAALYLVDSGLADEIGLLRRLYRAQILSVCYILNRHKRGIMLPHFTDHNLVFGVWYPGTLLLDIGPHEYKFPYLYYLMSYHYDAVSSWRY